MHTPWGAGKTIADPGDRLAMCGHHIRAAVPDLPQKAREIAVRLGSENDLIHYGTQYSDINYVFIRSLL
jgi:hypothetical protein